MAKPGRAVKLLAGAMIVAGAGLLIYTGYKVWDPFAGARQRLRRVDGSANIAVSQPYRSPRFLAG